MRFDFFKHEHFLSFYGREGLGYVQCKVFKNKEILQIISSVAISGNDQTSWDNLYYDEIKFKIINDLFTQT